jgi:1-acyl-sn-glycerol-3-phosphate acyltransferase
VNAANAILGGFALAGVLTWLGLVALPSLLLLSVAARWVSPATRLSWVSGWARAHCRFVLAVLRLGGARYERRGTVRTDAAAIIVMNHQSLLDIPTAVVMCTPLVPAFVARARYARVPLIATGLRVADCPVIDPGRDRDAALAQLADATHHERALLIYPEGHRTPDGSLQPFRTAGILAMLRARRVPVWLIATDGFWAGRRLIDLVMLHKIRGVTEVVGCFQPPDDDSALDGFVVMLEAELARAIAGMRRR